MLQEYEIHEHLEELGKTKPLEKYCHFCGDCCHLSVRTSDEAFQGRILIRDLPCKYLVRSKHSPHTYRCSVYADRFEVAPWCQDLKSGMVMRLYTDRCGYVQDLPGYQGPMVISDTLLTYFFPYIYESLKRNQSPFNKKDVEAFVDKWSHEQYG